MNSKEVLFGFVASMRRDARTLRERADFLDEAAARLKVYSEMASEEDAKDALNELKRTMPELFPS